MYTQAGEDATDAFAVFHPSSAFALLDKYYVGDVDEATAAVDATLSAAQRQRQAAFVASYRKLRLEVKRLGLYDSSKLYYASKLVSTLSLALAAAAICLHTESTALYMVAAVVLGLFYQQCGWLAHDFLHHQVFADHVWGDLVGLMVGNLWQGFSVQWWKNKHNTHHAIPNLHATPALGYHGDPDIDTMPVLAWSLHMAQQAGDSPVGRFFLRYQASLYLPILLLARMSWVLQSALYAFMNVGPGGTFDPVGYPLLERAGLLGYYGWNLALVYAADMSLLQALAFVVVSQASCGLFLAAVFSVGHNGMQVFDRHAKPDFWKLQVLSTRNVTSAWGVDWFMGGLNYQIDHHLFPMVPRHNLPKLNGLVKSLCHQYDIPFHETGLFQGLAEVVGHLRHISIEFYKEFPAM